MAKILVRSVTCAKTRRQFLDAPRAVYGKSTFPLQSRREVSQLAGLEPFSYYRHDVKRVAFVATRNGRCVGRVAANIHPEHVKRHPPLTACFGFYESVDDKEVSRALLNTISDWAVDHGVKRLLGPYGPSVNYYSGLRVGEFDQTPTYFTTHNPPYYVEHLEDFGFQSQRDMLAYRVTLDEVPQLEPRIAKLITEASTRIDLRVRFARRATIIQDLQSLMASYNESLKDMWGFLPLMDTELDSMVAWMKKMITPESVVLAEVDGHVVGAVWGLVDLNPLLVSKWNRILFGLLGTRLIRLRRRHLNRFRIVAAFVSPGYVRWGVGPAMLQHFIDYWTTFGMTEAEFSWVYDNNLLSRAPLEKWGLKPVVTHRVYEKLLT